MVLPAGTTLPPMPYLFGLGAVVAAVAVLLRKESATLSTGTVLAFAPWMVVGSGFYVLYQIGVVPAVIEPLFGSPAVYATTFVFAGVVWLLALGRDDERQVLGIVGGFVALVPFGIGLGAGAARGTLSPWWPLAGVVIAALLGTAVWYGFREVRPAEAEVLGGAGALAVLAHALDGVSTAVGVDVLGFGEQTPLSRVVLEVAGALPTAPILGVGWLFVLVKVALAVLVVWLLADMVREDPGAGNALLLLITAVGMGPGAHNVLLFAVLGSAGI